MHGRPSFDGSRVAGLVVGQFGINRESGVKVKAEQGFVLKSDADRFHVVIDLDAFHGLAFDFREAEELGGSFFLSLARTITLRVSYVASHTGDFG